MRGLHAVREGEGVFGGRVVVAFCHSPPHRVARTVKSYDRGFPVGFKHAVEGEEQAYFLNNHGASCVFAALFLALFFC